MSDTEREVFTPEGRKYQWREKGAAWRYADDFLPWAHDSTGENPLAWQASARDFLEAAMAVKAGVQPVEDGLMHTLAAVQAMLLGMASECLFKGMYIKRHNRSRHTTARRLLVATSRG